MAEDKNEDLDKTVVAVDTFKGKLDQAKDIPPSLVLLAGPIGQMGKQWFLNKPEMTVGRGPDSDIFVDDKSVSKTHCYLHIQGQNVTITDNGSTNGTEVQNQKLAANAPLGLKNNEQIKLGNVLFKFLEKGNIEAVAQQTVLDRSTIDALTEVHNRGAYEQKMDELFKRARLTETPLSIVVFDIDFFKKINDTQGHQAGDYVLKELAGIVQKQLIRQNDFFARIGGEEFALLMAGCPLKRAVEIAERIRTTIERHPFMFNNVQIPVTISSGVATLESEMITTKLLFEKADQALYVSKQTGRNKVSTI
jgi:two-component system, cell cycle response regulator